MLHWLTLAQGTGVLFLAWAISDLLYNLYFSRLVKVPGPKLYAISKLPWLYAWITGNATHLLADFHRKYGPVVRYSPNEVSFTSSSAWHEIYGSTGNKIFLKDKALYRTPPDGEDYLVVAQDHAVHSRQRRIISQAFSDKALREQEPIIKTYVDLLITRLRERAGSVLNAVEWYNWTTFDLIGDLAYGEPFGCLEKGEYHRWVSMIFDSVVGFAFITASKKLAPLDSIIQKLIPKKAMEGVKWRERAGREKFERRLQKKTDRKDFFAYILNQENTAEMTHGEMVHNSGLLIVAGSETTATLLSGITYLLLKHPECMARLVEEIRSTFKDESEINLMSCGSLKYLGAVINESGRLYPPAPFSLLRVASQDVVVDGYFIPKGTCASIAQYATYRLPSNFTDPDSFIPNRWLEPRDGDDLRAYQLFSFGPRNCVGRTLAYAEMRLILTRILWNFDLKLAEDNWTIENQKVFILWKRPDLKVIFTERSN